MVRRTAEQAAGTRRDILEAALQVFGECGFTAATLDRIAGRAGVTRGALYHHFQDKADLYDGVLRAEADQLMRPLMGELAGDGPPLERLGRFLESYGAALEQDARFRVVIDLLLFAGSDAPKHSRDLTGHGYQAWLTAFKSVLEEADARGELRTGVSPDVAAVAMVTLAVGVTTATLQSPGLFSPSLTAASLYDALRGGIGK